MCNGGGSCAGTPATDGDCGDGTTCDPNTCQSFGVCAANPGAATSCGTGICEVCNGGGSCSGTPATDSDCGDGTTCDPNTCQSFGVCAANPGAATSCGTGICEVCNGSGSCSGTPATDSDCGDGTTCDPNTCQSFGVCTANPGAATSCGTGICEVCNGSGSCSGTPATDSDCGDGSSCDPDTCQSFGVCTPDPGVTTETTCNDTIDNDCDGQSDCGDADCNGQLCAQNSDFCDGEEICMLGTCGSPGDPCDGPNDGDGDCSETCDEGANNCDLFDGVGVGCNDGLWCDGAIDQCVFVPLDGLCVQAGPGPCAMLVADGDSDCSEDCDESTDTCTAAEPDDFPCVDGVFCNGTDKCSAGVCSTHMWDACDGPNDGDADCTETCNEAGKHCNDFDGAGTPCDNGLWCDGPVDQCQFPNVCVQAGPGPCDPLLGVGDCLDACDESNDTCSLQENAGNNCEGGSGCCRDSDNLSCGPLPCHCSGTSSCP
ncbi:MAG: hypothetical protein A2341_01530 [Deltaproteobacteria bacterium RIFOXYB12_FULL_58_9]|nr:MAG: hypothetical protein A2341_01530 [Deltaproteobacteria bacterium RIFOXYB12_FULL_58_9]